MSRFDYVLYDDHAKDEQERAKNLVIRLEDMINKIGKTEPNSPKMARAKALALTKLEEVYMWIGKAIRDDQLRRNSDTILNEERG